LLGLLPFLAYQRARNCRLVPSVANCVEGWSHEDYASPKANSRWSAYSLQSFCCRWWLCMILLLFFFQCSFCFDLFCYFLTFFLFFSVSLMSVRVLLTL
jgi:hypothetical protein